MEKEINENIKVDRKWAMSCLGLAFLMLIINLIFENQYWLLVIFVFFLGLAIYFNIDFRYWQLRKHLNKLK